MTIVMSVITMLYDDNDVDNFYTKKRSTCRSSTTHWLINYLSRKFVLKKNKDYNNI